LTDLYLVRHGASASTVTDGVTRELGLSPEGVEQAQKLGASLTQSGEIRADVLLCSPLQRAQETAAILAPALNVPVTIDPALEEWRSDPKGELTDATFTERWKSTAEAQKPFYRFVPTGETWLEFATRTQSALNRILSEHEGKTVVIVTHGGVIQVSLIYFFGYSSSVLPRASVDMAHTSITHWRKPDARWILERFSDAHHLR
jgi:probable phosphoglycerate mutase